MHKMIVCTDIDGGIGLDNKIPWHSTPDFKHFKEYTIDSKVLMGYNTWTSLPNKSRPLPNRFNIVVTNRPLSDEDKKYAAMQRVQFIPEYCCTDFLDLNDNIIIIGGAKMYQRCISFCDEIALSTVNASYNCDVYFTYPENDFVVTSEKTLSDGVNVKILSRITYEDE